MKDTLKLMKGDSVANVDPGSEAEALYRSHGYRAEGETAKEAKEVTARAAVEHVVAASAAKTSGRK